MRLTSTLSSRCSRPLALPAVLAVVALGATGCAPGFLERSAQVPGANKLPSGLIVRTLTAAQDPQASQPQKTDRVQVHYTGRLVDGTEFDNSRTRGAPLTFPLDRVIPCWSEGLAMMKVGDKAELICPSELAYGENGKPPAIPGGATLIFEVELLAIVP